MTPSGVSLAALRRTGAGYRAFLDQMHKEQEAK
jgi:hypothetical protein